MRRWSMLSNQLTCVLPFFQACQFQFSYRLLPMGSYPKVANKNGTYDLFYQSDGMFKLINKLTCSSYDKAMVGFLACLQVRGHMPGSTWSLSRCSEPES